jgi:predicted DNA-binding transcriptional regulator YafY
VMDETFERPSDFDLPSYWHDHIQDFIASASEFTFTLRMHGSRLSFAQGFTPGRWEVLEPEGEDGWLTARFQMENMGLAKMLVFGLGNQAIVIEPGALREGVWETARGILQMPVPNTST